LKERASRCWREGASCSPVRRGRFLVQPRRYSGCIETWCDGDGPRRHREAGPTGAGKEATQRTKKDTVGELGRTSDLAPEDGYFVAQSQHPTWLALSERIIRTTNSSRRPSAR
jgi:hypothetical protein